MFGSDLVNAGLDLGGQIYSARSNRSSVSKQMRFQERMSNSAHQREVKDLLRAGLNPILSANRGASSPSGAASQIDLDVGRSVNTARSSQEMRQARELFASQKEMVDQQGRLAATQASKTLLEQSNVEQGLKLLEQQTISSEQDNAQKQMYLDYLRDNPGIRDTGYMMQSLGLTGNSAVSNAVGAASSIFRRKSTTDDDVITHRRDGSVTHRKSTTKR